MPDWKINVDPEVEARIMAAANHEEGDRVPIWDYLDNPPVYEHFRRGDEDPDVTMARAYNELGIDLCRGYALPLTDEERNAALTRWNIPRITTPEQLEEELKEPESSWDEIGPQLLEEYYRQRALLAPLTMRVPAAGTGLTELYAATGLQRFCEWIEDYDELLNAVLERRAEDNVRWTQLAARERLCRQHTWQNRLPDILKVTGTALQGSPTSTSHSVVTRKEPQEPSRHAVTCG